MALKGKEIAGKSSSGKRKTPDSGKYGGRNRKSRAVLQFFDVAADVDEDILDSDDSLLNSSSEEDDDIDFDQDFTDEVEAKLKGKEAFGKGHNLPFPPKEEELSDDELERLLEERYRSGSQYVKYAEDPFETKGFDDKNPVVPSTNGPLIWRVKCKVGRERFGAFCLIQKYVSLQSLGTKLKIVSVFALDHVKGHIYFEADRENDVVEACKGLSTIYPSKISQVPYNEVAQLLSVKTTSSKVSPGIWVRVKFGTYKGDLARVVAVDDMRKKATVKLIPRIDLQAMAKKLAGGGTSKQTTIPAARVISSTELEELRSYIHVKKHRQTGKLFETIDGLMLKDGYLYKEVHIESLSYLDIMPSVDEVLKFKTSSFKKDESDDTEWLSQLYGEQRKKRLPECSEGINEESEGTSGTKEGTSGAKKVDGFKLHDLIFFGLDDFGVIIRVEDDSFQVLKHHEADGAEVLSVELHEIRSGSLDKKFSILDKHMREVTIKDRVRVLDGPFQGKQGVVRHICRGTVFIYDENQLENGGYFCAKSHVCEKIKSKLRADIFQSKDTLNTSVGDGAGHIGFQDSTESPRDSQISKKPWQTRDNTRDFGSRRQGDRDGAFSIGQSLRIRVGPLKGHLCRVVAIYRSEVTVKLDTQLKIIVVKCENLSEAGVKSTRGAESSFAKPYEGFGSQGQSGGAAADDNGWNSASLSTARDLWPDFSGSDFLKDSTVSNPFESLITSDDPNKGIESDPWGSKVSSKKDTDGWGTAIGSGGEQKSSWGKPACEEKIADDKEGQINNWGRSEGGSRESTGWGAANFSSPPEAGCSKDAGGSWDVGKSKIGDCSNDATGDWGHAQNTGKTDDATAAWGSQTSKKNDQSGGWGNLAGSSAQPEAVTKDQGSGWNKSEGAAGGNWGTSNLPSILGAGPKDAGGSWGMGKPKVGVDCDDANEGWGKGNNTDRSDDRTGAWSSQASKKNDATGGRGATTLPGIHGAGPIDTGGGWDMGKTKVGDGLNEADDAWGKEKKDGKSDNAGDAWGSQASKKNDQTGGWGSLAVNSAPAEAAHKDQETGWGKTEAVTAGNWGAANLASTLGAGCSKNAGGGWGTGKSNTGDSLTDATDAWVKTSSKDNLKDSTSGWGKASKNNDQSGGWGSLAGGFSWSKGVTSTTEGGWNKGKNFDTGNDDSSGFRDQQDSWNREKSFDGGRGSGGRRGRGGFRGGNRDQSGGGRSFGRGRSSSWNNEDDQNKWNGDEDKSNSWNKGSYRNSDGGGGDWRGGRSFGGERGRGRTSGWNGGQSDDSAGGGTDFSNQGRGFGRGRSSGWNGGQSDDSAGDGTDFSNQGRGFGRGRSSGSNRGGGFGNGEGRGSNRGGGFGGGRGRGRRDQSGGGWNRGDNDGGGDWKSNNGSESWKPGGGWGSKQGWNNGSGSTNEAGGTSWKNGGSADKETGSQGWGGWNKSAGATNGTRWNNDSTDAHVTGGSAAKETGSQGWGGWNKSAGATNGTGWNNDSTGAQVTGGSAAKETGSQGWGGWNKSAGATNGTGWNDDSTDAKVSGGTSWNNGGGSAKETDPNGTGGWGSEKNANEDAGVIQGESWNTSDKGQGSGWMKEDNSGKAGGNGGWGKESVKEASATGWNNQGGTTKSEGWGGNPTQQHNGSDRAAAGANASSVDGKEETAGGSEQTIDAWGKAAAAAGSWEKKGW